MGYVVLAMSSPFLPRSRSEPVGVLPCDLVAAWEGLLSKIFGMHWTFILMLPTGAARAAFAAADFQ